MRALVPFALCFLALSAGADTCDDRRPWKRADAVEYPEAELRPFYEVARQSSDAYARGDMVEAKALATKYLSLAPSFKCDWNYGNAIHNANTILGLVALRGGDRAGAVRHLLAAGASRGSPQLDSFGPSLMLAKKLAEAGEHGAVATYIRSIRAFWTAEDTTMLGLLGRPSSDPMATWIAELEANRVPDFGMNARRRP